MTVIEDFTSLTGQFRAELLAQQLVTRISAGPVMALGMALIGGGILWAAQVPVHGHFWGALAGPFFVTGAGTAFAFVPVSIGGLAGVGGHEAGLASGLINTSQQLGGAIGVAIASTVAATRLGTLLGQGKPASVALTGGFQWALWVSGAIACSPSRPPPPCCAARKLGPTSTVPSRRCGQRKPPARSRRWHDPASGSLVLRASGSSTAPGRAPTSR